MTFKEVIKKYFHYVLKEKKSYFFFISFAILQAILTKFDPFIYGKLIDAVSDNKLNLALTLVIAFIIIKLLSYIISYLREFLGRRVTIFGLHKSSIVDYVESLQNVDYKYHTDKSSGSLISIAKRAGAAIPTIFWDINGKGLLVILEFITTFVFLFFLQPIFSLILFVTLITSLFVGYFLVKNNISYRNKFVKTDDKVSGLLVDNLIGFETVKIFAKEKEEKKRFIKSFDPWTSALDSYLKSFLKMDFILNLIMLVGLSSILFIGFYKVKDGILTIGTFVAAMFYVLETSKNMTFIVYKMRELAKFHVDIEKYFEVIDLKPEIKDPENPKEINHLQGEISFEELGFSYSEKNEALKNIDLDIKAQEKLALVGKSGSGKTTLTKLLMRFYDVNEGAIKMDGINIKDLRLEDLRSSIGLVPQDPVLFNDTIAYNIAYGKTDATQDEIETAAKKAQLHDFIITLPDGYKTIVGERGIKLSGGQKQRLAIARVILEDPPIVIFDEATSQLDSENEKLIQDAFDNLTKDKTTIIIAHRLSTIMNSDRIVVFHEGEIVQEGKHDELVNNDGIYRKLWKLQTETYI